MEILAAATRHEVWIDQLGADDARAEMVAFMPAVVVDSLLDYWSGHDGRPADVTDAVERIPGRPARTFDTWAREVAAPLVSPGAAGE